MIFLLLKYSITYIPKNPCTIKEVTATTIQQLSPKRIGLIPFFNNDFKLVLSPIATMAITIINLPSVTNQLER